MITYQKWTEVPYVCADGRVTSNHDFMPATACIEEFEAGFAKLFPTFLGHHTRAQVADAEWDYL